MAVTQTININVKGTKASKDLNKVSASAKGAATSTASVGTAATASSLATNRFTASAIAGMASVKSAVLVAKTAFSTLKGAIIATGIGALVVIVASLSQWFVRTEEGADKLRVAMAAINAVVDTVLDSVSALGKSLANLFTADLEQSQAKATEGMDNFGNSMRRDIELARELATTMNALSRAQRDLGILEAVTNRKVARFRLQAEDESIPLAERVQFLLQAQAEVKKLFKAKAKLAKAEFNAAKKQDARHDSTTQDAKELADLKAKYINILAEEDGLLRKLTKETQAFKDEALAKDKAISDALLSQTEKFLQLTLKERKLAVHNLDKKYEDQFALHKNNREKTLELDAAYAADLKVIDDKIAAKKKADDAAAENAKAATIAKDKAANDAKLTAIEQITQATITGDELEIHNATLKYDKLIALADKYNEDTTELVAAREAAILAIEKKAKDNQIALDAEVLNKKFAMTLSAISAISELVTASAGESEAQAKRAFQINKALSLGTAIINTSQAVAAALTGGGDLTKIARGQQFVEAGIAAVSGLAQVLTIKKTQFGGGGGVGPSPNMPSLSSPSQPASFNIVGQGSLNQLNQSIGQKFNQPLRAYVVGSDVNTGAELNRKRIKTATL